MRDSSQDILDLQEKKPDPDRKLFILRGGAYLMVLAGFVFKIMHWPFALILMLGGLGLWLLYATLSLIHEERSALYNWAYFIGKVALIIFLALRFLNLHIASFVALPIAVVAFIVGIISAPKHSD
jgi:hypothetical protein